MCLLLLVWTEMRCLQFASVGRSVRMLLLLLLLLLLLYLHRHSSAVESCALLSGTHTHWSHPCELLLLVVHHMHLLLRYLRLVHES